MYALMSGKMKALRTMLKTLRDETEEKIVVGENQIHATAKGLL